MSIANCPDCGLVFTGPDSADLYDAHMNANHRPARMTAPTSTPAGAVIEPVQPSAWAREIALTATPETFPTDSYSLALFLDSVRDRLAAQPAPGGVGELGSAAARERNPQTFERADRIVGMYRFDSEQDRQRAHEVARIAIHQTAALTPAAPSADAALLREALAEVMPYLEEGYLDDEPDDEPIGWRADSDGSNQRPVSLTFGMIRRVRAALAATTPAAYQ